MAAQSLNLHLMRRMEFGLFIIIFTGEMDQSRGQYK